MFRFATRLVFDFAGAATLVLPCHARLMLESSIKAKYLGSPGEAFAYDRELAEEALTYLKTYSRIMGGAGLSQPHPV